MTSWSRRCTVVAFCAVVAWLAAALPAAVIMQPGDIVVADTEGDTLYRVRATTGAATVISSGGHLHAMHGVAFDAQGRIIAVNDWDSPDKRGGIVRVDPATGAQELLFYGADADNPWDPIVMPDGSVLFSDYGNATSQGGRIRRLDPGTGAVTTLARGGPLRQTLGLARDGATLYITDQSGYVSPRLPRVLTFDLDTHAASVLSDRGLLDDPRGIERHPRSGDLYVADLEAAGGAIIRIDPDTGAQDLFSSGGLLMSPTDLAFDAAGNLLVTDYRGGSRWALVRIDATTGAQALVTPDGIPGFPGSVAVFVPEPGGFAAVFLAGAAVLRRRRPAKRCVRGGGGRRVPGASASNPEVQRGSGGRGYGGTRLRGNADRDADRNADRGTRSDR